MWWESAMGWGGWLAMTLGMAGFWVVVVLFFVMLARGIGPTGSVSPDAREILERRLASGDIDVGEFQHRLDALSKAHL